MLGLIASLFWLASGWPCIAEPLNAGVQAWEQPLVNRLRLGDGTVTTQRAASLQGFEAPIQPEWQYRFNALPGSSVTLRLGRIQGLDTLAAHHAGESRANSVSSPLQIFLNGRLFQEVDRNQSGASWLLPSTLLQGQNQLIIRAGHRLEGPLDIDDCEIHGVWVIQH